MSVLQNLRSEDRGKKTVDKKYLFYTDRWTDIPTDR